MKNMKRIHSVTIKRMIDESPDTSWLGEYSNRATSEYSIDREHNIECALNTGERAIDSKTRNKSDIAKSRCECADAKCHASWPEGTCQMAASYLFFRVDQQDASGTMFCSGCGDSAYESGLYVSAHDEELTEPECDCGEENVDMRRGEFQYFNPSFNYVDKQGNAKDLTPEEVRKYTRQDYEQMESLNRGDWCFIGVSAEAEYSIDSPNGSPIQTVTSGGLWGIESDSDVAYFAETEQEQLSELRDQLHAIGFSKRAIATAFKNVERQEN